MSKPIKKRRDLEHLKGILIHFLGSKHFGFKVLAYVFLIVILISWIPQVLDNGLRLLIENLPIGTPILGGLWLWKLVICALILVFFIFLAKKIGKQKGSITVLAEEYCQGQVMAIFLSTLSVTSKNQDKKEIPRKIKKIVEQLQGKRPGEKEKVELRGLIDETNWKMPLLAILNHHNTLEEVYAICSRDSIDKDRKKRPGSHREFDLFKAVFETVLDKKGFIREFPRSGIDFENVKDSFEIIEKFYDSQIKKGVRKERIVVDVTGGQKTSSIGSALATLALGRKFQYVSTTDGKVNLYDIDYNPPDE